MPDRRRLSRFLRELGLSRGDDFQLAKLSGGQSNPTFRLTTDSGCYVLRRQPAGQLVASAHAIDREFRVMQALRSTDVPVPRMLAYCDDATCVGTPFYLMEFLEGRVFHDPALPGLPAAERRIIYVEMVRVLAALHAVDWRGAGLEGFGRPENYFARQIARWTRQCRESGVALDPAMERLIDWLPRNIPAGDEAAIVHGDFRMDNLLFHPTQARVIGVLDWELSTLGHPLSDLAYNCMAWRIPPELWRGIGGLDLAALGIPGEAQYVLAYEASSGRSAAAHWNFYLACSFFRIAAILYGIARRAVGGTATSADAAATGERAGPLARLGWQCV